jgi:hypothetical protein
MPLDGAESARLPERLRLQLLTNQAAKERLFSWFDENLDSLGINAELDWLACYYNHRKNDERSRRLTVLSTFGWNGVRIVEDPGTLETRKIRYCVQLLVGDLSRAETPPEAYARPSLFEAIHAIVQAIYPVMVGRPDVPIDIPMPVAGNVPLELVSEITHRMNSCGKAYFCGNDCLLRLSDLAEATGRRCRVCDRSRVLLHVGHIVTATELRDGYDGTMLGKRNLSSTIPSHSQWIRRWLDLQRKLQPVAPVDLHSNSNLILMCGLCAHHHQRFHRACFLNVQACEIAAERGNAAGIYSSEQIMAREAISEPIMFSDNQLDVLERRGRGLESLWDSAYDPEMANDPDTITTMQWQDLLIRQRDRCNACGVRTELTADHIIPRAQGGGHNAGNIQGLCRSCNSAKGKRSWAEFVELRRRKGLPIYCT